MIKYALVSPQDEILEFRFYETPPDAATDTETKPRLVPVTLQDVVWDEISEVHVGPVYTVRPSDVLEVWTKRAKTSQEVEEMRQSKIAEINVQADIHLDMSFQQQLRSLSRLTNLLYRHTDISSWPPAQQASVAEHQSRLDNIDDVRQTEAAKTAQVEALQTPQEIHDYDATAGWD